LLLTLHVPLELFAIFELIPELSEVVVSENTPFVYNLYAIEEKEAPL